MWAFSFLKHSPLGKRITGNQIPTGVRRLTLSFASGGPPAITGSLAPSPGQYPFPSPEKECHLHNWVPCSFCALK